MPKNSVDQILCDKKSAKKNFCSAMKISHRKPLIAAFLDNELNEKIANKLKELAIGTKVLDAHIVILADTNLETMPSEVLFPYSRKNRKLLLDAGDIVLPFSFNDVEEFLLHGLVPVSIKREELTDYNPNKEMGNAFICSSDNPWSIFAGIVRATETYKFPYDWKHLIVSGIESVK
ncbi:hypothetical protein GF354_05050 [Candidatus Peregrinibacteria bacterium]|nr:hypothetical protein [Candidatus Peregrinibacteria bacterium]